MSAITIIDGITGEQITREMTTQEKLDYDARATERAKEQLEIAKAEVDKAATRAAVLTRLGLTSDELLALLS